MAATTRLGFGGSRAVYAAFEPKAAAVLVYASLEIVGTYEAHHALVGTFESRVALVGVFAPSAAITGTVE